MRQLHLRSVSARLHSIGREADRLESLGCSSALRLLLGLVHRMAVGGSALLAVRHLSLWARGIKMAPEYSVHCVRFSGAGVLHL